MNALLKALGVTDESEGIVALAKMNAFLTSIMALFGTREFSESLAVISSNCDMVKAVEKLTDKTGSEAIGTITAWQAAEGRATKAEGELTALNKGIETGKATALIDGAIADERIEPAKRESAQALYDDHGFGALEAFVKALPAKGTAVNANPGVRPPADPTVANGPLNPDEIAVMKATGKTEADMLKVRAIQAVGTNDVGEEGVETRFIKRPQQSNAA